MLYLPPDAVTSEPDSTHLIKFEGVCDHGLHKQPNGPMAALIFCEGALGTYLGLVYYEPMGAPVPIKFHSQLLKEEEKQNYYKVWSLENRLWQNPLWSSDVTSYAWGLNGKRIFIATSNIYGSGAIYELDLIRRNYKQIEPKGKIHSINDPGPGFLIIKITSDWQTT